jgi:hypothetical protein
MNGYMEHTQRKMMDGASMRPEATPPLSFNRIFVLAGRGERLVGASWGFT